MKRENQKEKRGAHTLDCKCVCVCFSYLIHQVRVPKVHFSIFMLLRQFPILAKQMREELQQNEIFFFFQGEHTNGKRIKKKKQKTKNGDPVFSGLGHLVDQNNNGLRPHVGDFFFLLWVGCCFNKWLLWIQNRQEMDFWLDE